MPLEISSEVEILSHRHEDISFNDTSLSRIKLFPKYVLANYAAIPFIRQFDCIEKSRLARRSHVQYWKETKLQPTLIIYSIRRGFLGASTGI